MATDLERFVDAPGRAEKVKAVRNMIDELGIEYLYLQFVSVTGRIMGKGIPADHWENDRQEGLSAGLRLDGQPVYRPFAGNYIGYGPESAELVGIPETGNFHAAAVGQAHRPILLFAVPQPRGKGKSGRCTDL